MRTLVVSSRGLDPVSTSLHTILRARLDGDGPLTADYQDIGKHLGNGRAVELVAVVLAPDPESGLVALRRVRELVTGVVLAVGPAADPKLILRALNEGADHYIDDAELEPSLEAVLPRVQGKEQSAGTGRLIA